MSEIDDIFAPKGKSTAPQPVASTSTLSQKKKKDKKRKREVDPEDNAEVSQRNSRPAPQTIIDPSILISNLKPPKIDRSSEATKPKVSKSTAQGADDEDRFKDSRGSVSSRCLYLHRVSI